MGNSASPKRSFSGHVSIWLLLAIAHTPFQGAGSHDGKSKRENSPGESGIAKIMACSFHCRRSSMSSSANRFIMFGYAPKKMCSPVSIQSPSSSCQADTLPPRTLPRSSTMGLWPASARYLAHDRPASPPPTMATVFGSTPFSPRDLSFLDSAAAARKFSESRSGLGKSLAVTRRRRGAAARKACCWRRSGRAWPMRAVLVGARAAMADGWD
mmetsp:Transcript_6540/g.24294  ORF Transcript_6540/g.24294 Transcript_6540/m.24294 type:complete len:212 (-) Transcript_6540:85-720(-)